MTAATNRTALSFGRDLEFATETELAKRMGCSKYYWLRAALKELIDNSLDACEEAGIETPAITVTVEGDQLSVGDNGPGMLPELVERLCIRSERTSTREAYAAADRGSQGNALPTLMALPLALDRDAGVTTITSRGVEHTITLRVNRLAGRIDLERTTRGVADTPGTTISMTRPPTGCVVHEYPSTGLREVVGLIADHAWLNPHVAFDLNDGWWTAEPTASVAKWTPGMATPPHWYSRERFAHRVLLEIRRDPGITIAQFLGGFRGLTSRTRRSEVAAAAGLSYAPLAALLDDSRTAVDPGRTLALLTAMQAASRPPKHAALGAVGKDTVAAWAANHGSGEPQLLAYTIVDGVINAEIPFRWEIGFCHLPGLPERSLLIGQNFSPAVDSTAMINAVLRYCPRFLQQNERIALFLHRITPARQTLDYGKSRLAIDWLEAEEVHTALEKIAAPWIKRRSAEMRGKKPPPTPSSEKAQTFQDAAFSAMADAYAGASSNGKYPVLSQQVFYKARPTILELTRKEELKPHERSRLCYTLLPLFMQQNPELTRNWRVIYKPRGELIEPHTGRRIGLGTTEVAAYCARWTNGAGLGDLEHTIADWEPETHGPCHRYGAVVAVEKGGIADVLRQIRLDDRRDVAIIGNEGQSVEAEFALIDALGHTDVDVPVFLLTDFDRQGFTIAENLRAGTWRHRYRNPVKVVHVGLRLEQINTLGGLASKTRGGLEDEPIGEGTLKHVSDDRLRECGAIEEEVEILRTRRVELNALSTEQLVAMLEGALAEHGIGKVIPDPEHLRAAWRAAKAHAEIAEAIEEANKRAARWQAERAPDDLAEQVRELLKRYPEMSWDTALRLMVEERRP